MNKSNVKKVTIPADIIAELEAVPSSARDTSIKWTAEQDAILLQYYPIKNKKALGRYFQERFGYGSGNTLAKRYKKLTGAK